MARDAILDTIEDALKRGSEVTLSGFGKFSVSQRSAREGRNPAAGERIHMAASRIPKFTARATLKQSLQGSRGGTGTLTRSRQRGRHTSFDAEFRKQVLADPRFGARANDWPMRSRAPIPKWWKLP